MSLHSFHSRVRNDDVWEKRAYCHLDDVIIIVSASASTTMTTMLQRAAARRLLLSVAGRWLAEQKKDLIQYTAPACRTYPAKQLPARPRLLLPSSEGQRRRTTKKNKKKQAKSFCETEIKIILKTKLRKNDAHHHHPIMAPPPPPPPNNNKRPAAEPSAAAAAADEEPKKKSRVAGSGCGASKSKEQDRPLRRVGGTICELLRSTLEFYPESASPGWHGIRHLWCRKGGDGDDDGDGDGDDDSSPLMHGLHRPVRAVLPLRPQLRAQRREASPSRGGRVSKRDDLLLDFEHYGFDVKVVADSITQGDRRRPSPRRRRHREEGFDARLKELSRLRKQRAPRERTDVTKGLKISREIKAIKYGSVPL